MKEIRVGIIGCGGFGNFHLTRLLQMEGVCVTALAAGNQLRLDETGARVPQAKRYHSGQEMLEREELDAVIICVTPSRHEDLELCAVRRGVAVYVEKPIGMDRTVVQETAKQLEAYPNIVTAVGYQERYNPAVERVRAYLQTHPVGLVSARWIGTMPGAAWWRKKSASGGQMVEQTTHLFDLLRNLFGEAKEVYAQAVKQEKFTLPDHDVEEASVALVQFQNGVVAQVASACYVREEAASDIGFTIYADDVRIDYRFDKTLTWHTKEGVQVEQLEGDFHFEAMQAFVEAVRNGDPKGVRSSYQDGVKSLMLSLAAEQSLKTGLPLQL